MGGHGGVGQRLVRALGQGGQSPFQRQAPQRTVQAPRQRRSFPEQLQEARTEPGERAVKRGPGASAEVLEELRGPGQQAVAQEGVGHVFPAALEAVCVKFQFHGDVLFQVPIGRVGPHVGRAVGGPQVEDVLLADQGQPGHMHAFVRKDGIDAHAEKHVGVFETQLPVDLPPTLGKGLGQHGRGLAKRVVAGILQPLRKGFEEGRVAHGLDQSLGRLVAEKRGQQPAAINGGFCVCGHDGMPPVWFYAGEARPRPRPVVASLKIES
jgi:hypothetical protein